MVNFVFDSYSHHRLKPPVSRSGLTGLLETCIGHKIGTLHYLFIDDEAIAGLFLLNDEAHVYALFSGIDGRYRNENYTEYLHAAALQAPESEHKTFDFLGANTQQFDQFKRSFGGNLDVFYRVRFEKNGLVRLLAKGRQLYHLLLRRRPGLRG
jgi:hypothetical protein